MRMPTKIKMCVQTVHPNCQGDTWPKWSPEKGSASAGISSNQEITMTLFKQKNPSWKEVWKQALTLAIGGRKSGVKAAAIRPVWHGQTPVPGVLMRSHGIRGSAGAWQCHPPPCGYPQQLPPVSPEPPGAPPEPTPWGAESQTRGASTPMACERGGCVHVTHTGSVTESDLEIYSCLLPFDKWQVLWLSVVLLVLSLKVQFRLLVNYTP